MRPKPLVRADELDDVVLERLFETFGNPEAVKKAIDEAVPNKKKMAEFTKRKERIEAELAKKEQAENRVLDLVEKDRISQAKAEKRLDKMDAEKAALQDELDQLASVTSDLPSKGLVGQVIESVTGHKLFFKTSKRRGNRRYTDAKLIAKQQIANERFERMTRDDKRALVEKVFNGRRSDGLPCGVYLKPIDGQQHHRRMQWAFKLHGLTPIDGIQCVTQPLSRSSSRPQTSVEFNEEESPAGERSTRLGTR